MTGTRPAWDQAGAPEPAAYVRTLLEREVQRQKLAAGGQRHADFVRDSPEESAWLEEWDRADLASPPSRSRR